MTTTESIRFPLADITAGMTDSYYADSLAKFTSHTAQHVMEVAHDDGVYRHLRFRNPDSIFYWFDILTSSGLLTLNGDVGTFTFSRVHDMLEFFTGNYINPQYWGEKLRASSAYQSYSPKMLKRRVNDDVAEHLRYEEWPQEMADALRRAVEEDVLHYSYSASNSEAH